MSRYSLCSVEENICCVIADMSGQDASGWTPLMIAASLRDGDDLVDLLLGKEADVNAKSRSSTVPLTTARV